MCDNNNEAKKLHLCIICGKETKSSKSDFCSRKCYHETLKVEKVCTICDKTFRTLKYKKDAKYCSRKCNGKATSERYKKNRENISVALNCTSCGDEFTILKCFIDQTPNQKNRFCNRDCYLDWHKALGEEGNCPACGKEVFIPKADNKKYCDRECYKKDFKQNQRQYAGSYYKGWYNSCKADKVYYDSSWERRRMKELDYDNSVIKWTRCKDKIKWFDDNNKSHYYNPDFLIEYKNGDIVVEEIKGYRDRRAELKIAAAKEFYKDADECYRVIDNLESFNENIEMHTSTYSNDYGVWERPTYEYIWITVVQNLSLRSTCLRNKVGCVITDPQMSKALCLGYNGDHPGGKNQCDSLEPGKCNCIHAEINAITKSTQSLNGCVAFVSLAPCYSCAKILLARGITRVVYNKAYRSVQGIKLLRDNDVLVQKYNDLIRYGNDV